MVILGAIQVLSLFGYLGGFFDRTDKLEWHEFEWDQSSIISTVLLWISWGASIFVLLRSNTDNNTKYGGAILISLPLAMFLFIFLELITLGPR